MSSRRSRRLLPALVLVVMVVLGACSSPNETKPVVSHLEGVITVRAEIDSVRDYRGFEILVASADGLADTLGFAVTDSTGRFGMRVRAPEKGIYPLLVRRRGALLKQGQLVVADGDSASLNLRVPDGRRPLVIRSQENAAWMAYRNTKATHNRDLLELIQKAEMTSSNRDTRFLQTSALLWNLGEQFAGTIGAEIASAESIIMLEGIEDSLVVARAAGLDVESPSFPEVARAVRRSESRLRGLESAIGLLETYRERASEARQRAALESEIVLALVDSARMDRALARARGLEAGYPGSEWAEWAKEAIYELENLMPGMEAPPFQAQTWGGDAFDLGGVTEDVVLLEFFSPSGEAFLRETPQRDTVARAITRIGGTYVALSVEPDSVLNEAFFEFRDASRVQIALAQGLEDPVAQTYNVNVLPKRFLLHRGRIVGKYAGTATLPALHADVVSLAARPPS